jgi:hypothetical protein
MADSPVPRYLFGIPPKDYDPEYFREVLRTFSLFQTQLANPGKVTANELNLKPANAGGIRQFANNVEAYTAGLQPGDVWMLSTGEIRVVVSPDVDVPVSLEVHRQAVGQVGNPTTFDASAEIGETPIHFMAAGQVGQITTRHTYNFTGVVIYGNVGAVTVSIT